jgi:hypothetical protein
MSEYYLLVLRAFMAGMLRCFIETMAVQKERCILIPCTNIFYEGKSKRNWPK